VIPHSEDFEAVTVWGQAPAGTTQIAVYLYTHALSTPKLLVRSVFLVPSARQPVPEPNPPVYSELKDLHIDTELVKEGRPNTLIVTSHEGTYDQEARRIQHAIAQITGVTFPIVTDTDPEAAVHVPSEWHTPNYDAGRAPTRSPLTAHRLCWVTDPRTRP